jgi:hypothetical protein
MATDNNASFFEDDMLERLHLFYGVIDNAVSETADNL